MIAGTDIRLELSGQAILSGVSMELGEGEVVALCGPNGAGKSTLLACLAGEHPGCAQAVRYGADVVADLAPHQQARRRAVLEQFPSLSADFTVRELIELGAPLDVAPDTVMRHGTDALQALGIGDLAGRFVATLSGGQQHRAHLARILVQLTANRALGHDCALFLDEPTASLDLRHQMTVLMLTADLARDGVGVLIVLHDLNLAAAFADRIVLMKDGTIAYEGLPETVLTADRLSDVYDTPISVAHLPDGQRLIHPDLPRLTIPARCA